MLLKTGSGAKGLAEDVRRYGYWMREEAFKRIGHLYPQVDLDTGLPVFPSDIEIKEECNAATVIAWIWYAPLKAPIRHFLMWMCHWHRPLSCPARRGKKPDVQPVIEGDKLSF